jgi:hypothetical protein
VRTTNNLKITMAIAVRITKCTNINLDIEKIEIRNLYFFVLFGLGMWMGTAEE